MTTSDPPRLRNERGLPADLVAALRSSDSDGLLPSPQALNELERGLLAALGGSAGLTLLSSAARGGKLPALAKLISSKLGVVVLHLMLGATAGVCVMAVVPLYRVLTSAKAAPARPVPAAAVTLSKRVIDRRAAAAPAITGAADLSSPSAIDREPPRDAPVAEQPASAPRALPSAQPSTRGASAGELSELSEVDLIERAHRALASDPQRALAWLREDERRFPDGTFAQERDAIAIEALVAEGDLVGARARAQLFLVRFPGSAYAAHVESLVRTYK